MKTKNFNAWHHHLLSRLYPRFHHHRHYDDLGDKMEKHLFFISVGSFWSSTLTQQKNPKGIYVDYDFVYDIQGTVVKMDPAQ